MNTDPVPMMVPLRRTFAAALAPMHTPERAALNSDALTSQYYRGMRYVVRKPFLMSDGTPNLVQPFTTETFRTKGEAEAWIKDNT